MNVQVRIGRNVGTEPLPDEEWVAFIVKASKLLGPGVHVHLGEGAWDGVSEENATLTGPAPDDGSHRLGLAWLAGKYRQDAIALLVEGTSHWLLIDSHGNSSIGDRA